MTQWKRKRNGGKWAAEVAPSASASDFNGFARLDRRPALPFAADFTQYANEPVAHGRVTLTREAILR